MPIGNKLVEARQRKALTEEQASMETCIPLGIIRSLEADDYSAFDSTIYAKNFLKTYSRYLDLNINQLLSKFDEVSSESQTFFKANCETLKDTARPEIAAKSRNPLFLAPLLVGIFIFLCFCLFSLLTGRNLPFQPKTVAVPPAESASAETSEASGPEGPLDNAPQEPISRKTDLTARPGAYLLDFDTSTAPIFLTPSESGGLSSVLP